MSDAKLLKPVRYWEGKTFSEEHKNHLKEARRQMLLNNPEYKLKLKLQLSEAAKNRFRKYIKIISLTETKIVFMTRAELSVELNVSEFVIKKILTRGYSRCAPGIRLEVINCPE